jgi:hypothetical protein
MLPIVASAQLVTISGPLTASDTVPSGSLFHDLAWAMTNDNEGLYSAPWDPIPDDPRDLSTKTSFSFDTVNDVWEGTQTFDGDHINFTQIPNKPHFFLYGTADIAYIGNESSHDNELWMAAYSLDMQTVQGPTMLADYDDGDPNSTPPLDVPPVSWNLSLIGAEKVMVQFLHVNRNLPVSEMVATQACTERFTFWAGMNEIGEYTGDFLMAISDRDGKKDADVDDGLFYFRGEITPVPEPSQIAGLALLGLGAALFIRRRLARKS